MLLLPFEIFICSKARNFCHFWNHFGQWILRVGYVWCDNLDMIGRILLDAFLPRFLQHPFAGS